MDTPNPAKADLRIGCLWGELVGDGGRSQLVVGPPALVEAHERTSTAAALLGPAALRLGERPAATPEASQAADLFRTRDQLISEASKIALSRRYADDEERFEAMLALAGEHPQDQFDAQLMLSCVIFVLDELGSEAVLQIRDRAEGRSYQ